MSKTTGTYQMSDWQESILRDGPPPQKCTTVAAPGTFSGPIQGIGQTHYIMNYLSAKTGTFFGYTFFEGSIGTKKGSFVLIDKGKFDEKSADSKWAIAPDSGTGELTGISGSGGYSATDGLTIPFELDLDFADQDLSHP